MKSVSIIADETKDIKKQEQISLVLRYYYNGAIQESFLFLNLVLENTVEAVLEVEEFFYLLEKLCVHIWISCPS